MMLPAYCFLLGMAIGALLWVLARAMRPRAGGVEAAHQDEAAATAWRPVVVNGRIVHATREDRP